MIFNIKINSNLDIEKLNCTIKETETPEVPQEIYGFNNKLNIQRNKIDKINCDIWKKVRWYINNYDFLVKEPIINRAFYKYWEIINVFNIFEDYTDIDNIFHCAEAPGGFIQGSNMYLKLDKKVKLPKTITDSDGFTRLTKSIKLSKDYKIFTISLNKDLLEYKDYNLPNYNNKVINRNVCITYGVDKTGDINNLDNITFIKSLINENGSYLITADGGFDEGSDFNNKEQLHYFLILNEIYSAIYLQKNKGHFILKVFDVFTLTSINLLYLLNLVYSDVFIYKPKTSRPTNSEKYIICKNFILDDFETKNKLLLKLRQLSESLKLNKNKYNSFTLFDEGVIPESFVKNVKNMNNNLVNNQCKHLEIAINLCENKEFMNNYEVELDSLYDKRISVFKKWKTEFNLS